MLRLLSLKKRLSALLAPKPLADVPSGFRAALEKRVGSGKILHCLRAEKAFHKSPSSFAGETFFRVVAVVTDANLLLAKQASEYQEIKNFPLAAVAGCAAQTDSAMPALLVNFLDGSELRLVFSLAGTETRALADELNAAAAKAETGGTACAKCGAKAQVRAKFCAMCGAPTGFG